MLKRTLPIAFLGLSACISGAPICEPMEIPQPPEGSLGWQGIGQTIVDGAAITPVRVIEDSRCPIDLHCITGGRVVVRTELTLPGEAETRTVEMSMGQRERIADGQVMLVGVWPDQHFGCQLRSRDYLFAYRFYDGR